MELREIGRCTCLKPINQPVRDGYFEGEPVCMACGKKARLVRRD